MNEPGPFAQDMQDVRESSPVHQDIPILEKSHSYKVFGDLWGRLSGSHLPRSQS